MNRYYLEDAMKFLSNDCAKGVGGGGEVSWPVIIVKTISRDSNERKIWGSTGRAWNTVTHKPPSLEGWSPGIGWEQRDTRISFYSFGPDSTTYFHWLYHAHPHLSIKHPLNLKC